MKINTKKMTNINKATPDGVAGGLSSCFFNPSKYLSEAGSQLKGESGGEKAGGTVIRFIPTIFYTPVKTSARQPNRPGALDAAGVEELNKAFAELLVDEKGDDQDKIDGLKPITPRSKDKLSKSQAADKKNFDAAAPKLGRYKSAAHSNALRSYRLARKVD